MELSNSASRRTASIDHCIKAVKKLPKGWSLRGDGVAMNPTEARLWKMGHKAKAVAKPAKFVSPRQKALASIRRKAKAQMALLGED